MSMWISTKDRLPADDQECIFYMEDEDLFIVGYKKDLALDINEFDSWRLLHRPRKKNEPRYPNVDYAGNIIDK